MSVHVVYKAKKILNKEEHENMKRSLMKAYEKIKYGRHILVLPQNISEVRFYSSTADDMPLERLRKEFTD